MRKKIVAGNWKMNLTKRDALSLYQEISQKSADITNVEMLVFSPLLFLDALKQEENKRLKIGAQNFFYEPSGAFTGEVSHSQLKDLGILNVLVGHSERRMVFKEDDTIIRSKVDAAIAAEMNIIYCCGEPLEIRESDQHIAYVIDQMKNTIFHLKEADFQQIVIAYEPIWAIGTGKTATPDQAEEMHEQIRKALSERYSETLSEKVTILYGGSCNPKNAAELFAKPNIDGGLIGGASLKADDFIEIAKSY